MIKALIFDWGDTIMRDYPELKTPMFTWEHVELIPFIEIALQKLEKEYIMVIATNAGQSDTAALIKALERVNVKKYFHHFFSSKDLGFEKPDTRFFKSIATSINQETHNCLMIGNLYEKDIIGAKNAGMKTILFDEKKSNLSFPEADQVIHSFLGLEKLVKSISTAI